MNMDEIIAAVWYITTKTESIHSKQLCTTSVPRFGFELQV